MVSCAPPPLPQYGVTNGAPQSDSAKGIIVKPVVQKICIRKCTNKTTLLNVT